MCVHLWFLLAVVGSHLKTEREREGVCGSIAFENCVPTTAPCCSTQTHLIRFAAAAAAHQKRDRQTEMALYEIHNGLRMFK